VVLLVVYTIGLFELASVRFWKKME
jgi:hypothetical protein